MEKPTSEDIQKILVDQHCVEAIAGYFLDRAMHQKDKDPGAVYSFAHYRGVTVGALSKLRDNLTS